MQVGSRRAVRGVELEHVRLLCPLFAGRRGFSWCGDCSCCAQAGRSTRDRRSGGCVVAAAGSIADARCDPASLDRARPTAARSRAQNCGLPAAPGRLLRGDGLAPPDDEAGGDGVAVRAVLHLRPAARRRQVAAAGERGEPDPRARAGVPRARGDQRHRLDRLGRRRPATPGTRPASRRGGGWPSPATTSPPATPGR